MQRRKFLVGIGGTGIGASALVGSGAFSRVESRRNVRIDTAEDPEAYLGLDACDSKHGDNYVEIGDDGHLEIELGENPAGGEGVNSNSLSFFDNVFQICNQGKEKSCVYIDAEMIHDDTSLPVVDFYVYDGPEQRSIRGEEKAIGIEVGECICVGIRLYTKNLEAGDRLLEDDEMVVVADADDDRCPQLDDPDPDPDPNGRAISWVAFCGEDLDETDISPTVETTDEDGDPLTVSWQNVSGLQTVVIFGAAQLWNVDPGASPAGVGDGTFVEWGPRTEQRPPSPCPDGECGPKFDWNGAFNPAGHQDECAE